MKLTEKKTKRMEIRLSEDDLKYLKICAFMVGQTPTQLVRMFIDTTINNVKIKIKQGEIKIEDFEGIFDNKL